jgi:inorganic pyrophosphatase
MHTEKGIGEALGLLFKAHPWHGVPIGPQAPASVTVYVEMVPTDTVKYEMDKLTGLLVVDRPQKYSNVCPTLYGLVPRTYCGPQVAAFCEQRTARSGLEGDLDPLDICVLTEKAFSHGNILVRARPIGGLRMLDGSEVDDKILGVLEGDAAFGGLDDVTACPEPLVERLRHYFLTYKQGPDQTRPTCEITHVYGRDEALEVVRRSQADYLAAFGDPEAVLRTALTARGGP